MVGHGVGPGDQAEDQGRREGEGREEEHLEGGDAEARRGDDTTRTQRFPTVTVRFQKLISVPFMAGGAWL